ncbi:MAG: hypothetical protein BAJALOKI2v1_710001, partial [Promethearchaeota archaeon]
MHLSIKSLKIGNIRLGKNDLKISKSTLRSTDSKRFIPNIYPFSLLKSLDDLLPERKVERSL